MSPRKSPNRRRLETLHENERRTFIEQHPRSGDAFQASSRSLLRGVPMSWMSEWASPFPIFLAEAHGAQLSDVDGVVYDDFCLGDTAALAGHAPGPTVKAVEAQVRCGSTAMLPTRDAEWVGGELGRRFGLPIWQFSLSATDANRWVLRLARELTGRNKVMVFDGCYHGTVDETVVELDQNGRPASKTSNLGRAFDPTTTTALAEFNDLESVERGLRSRQIACVLTEPAMTNAGGIIPPARGFHAGLRRLTRDTGTYLAIDETQTFPNGPGGCTRDFGLEPDFFTIGKAIAGGVALGAFGMTRAVAEAIEARGLRMSDVGAVGGTLAGNPLSLAAARATLGEVLTDESHQRMNSLGRRFELGINALIQRCDLAWHVVRLGSRVEYRYSPAPPNNARVARAAVDSQLDAFLHLYLLNRGILITPFNNMALMCPATTEAQVDHHLEVLAGAVETLFIT